MGTERMKRNQIARRRGATLGLVAIVCLVIFLIGFAFFVVARIMGGGREVNNATDAGILNTAKRALTVETGPVPLEFSQCTVPENSNVSLLTYNRLVAQALMVAMNADAQGMGQANAAATWAEVEALGQKLKTELADNPTTRGFFHSISQANNTKMWGDNVKAARLYQSFMKRGGSTNIYMDPNSFPYNSAASPPTQVAPPANLYSAGPLTAANGQSYMRGYEAIRVAGIDIFGVPVFPGVNPHLVNKAEFDANLTEPDESVPFNSFKADSFSQEKTTAQMGGAVAAAIVGAVLQTDGTSQFRAAIPGGYIEIVNLPAKTSPYDKANSMDASNGIFNNQLYVAPGIHVTNNINTTLFQQIAQIIAGVGQLIGHLLGLLQEPDPDKASLFNQGHGIFSTNRQDIEKWITYNNSTGNPNDQYGHDGNLFPGDPANSDLRIGRDPGQKPTIDECLMITEIQDSCLYTSYDDGFAGPCGTNLVNFIGNYSTSIPPGGGDNSGFMNLEYTKANVLNELYDGQWCGNLAIPVPGGKSGLKKFDHNQSYPTPQGPLKFAEVTNPYDLLVQVDGCSLSSGGTFDQIYQRCCQIVPGLSKLYVRGILKGTDIPMGTTLYVYKNPGASTLVMSTSRPSTYSGVAPDGPLPDQTSASCMANRYDAYGLQVNTSRDGNLHERPYVGQAENGIYGVDRALWQPSSGHKNLLGRLELSNDVEGGGKLCYPN